MENQKMERKKEKRKKQEKQKENKKNEHKHLQRTRNLITEKFKDEGGVRNLMEKIVKNNQHKNEK